MLSLAYYLLKIIICSAVLYGYYWCFLRNKIFHRYNRFYLLATIVLSMTLPLLKFNVWEKAATPKTGVVQMLQVINSSDEYVGEIIIQSRYTPISKEQIAGRIFITISAIFAGLFITTILKIYSLKKNNTQQRYNNISLIHTTDKRTPFSFLKNIFWNDEIDINSESGNRILKHELVHVHERHSYDKLFINIILIFFWCNPVFWLLRKEINLLHEFLADKKAVEDGDTAAFATMILQATYPGHLIGLANNFFYSSIKRRIYMLAKNNKTKVNYISRLLALPLAIIVFATFTLKAKTYITALPKGKIITVVIDAGHGGTDDGAKGIDGSNEKDINLLLVKKIKELNKDENLKIILTRETDLYQDPKEKAQFTNKINPDLFVSIHLGAGPVEIKNSSRTFEAADIYIGSGIPEGSVTVSAGGNTLKKETDYKINYKEGYIKILNKSVIDAGSPVQVNFSNYESFSGMHIYVSNEEFANSKPSSLFASAVLNSFQNNYSLMVPGKPIQRKAGIWVLQEAKCPAILIEAGNMLSKTELAYLQSEQGQNQFAKNILNAINVYETTADNLKVDIGNSPQPIAQHLGKEIPTVALKDTNPTFKPLLNKIERDIFIDASQVVVTNAGDVSLFGVRQFNLNKILPEPLVIINGKESTIKKIKSIDPAEFGYLRILKPETAIPIYGEKAGRGVLIVNTKLPDNNANFSIHGTHLENPGFKIGDLSGPRINIDEFRKQKTISLSPGIRLLSATIYFSGKGFDNIETAVLTKPQLSVIEELIDRCVVGSVITFDEIKVADEKNNGWDIEGKSYQLVEEEQPVLPNQKLPTLTLSGISTPGINVSELNKIKELACSDNNYKIVSSTLYFSGEGFKDIVVVSLNDGALSSIKNYMQKIVDGTILTFDNVIISKKDGSNQIEIEGKSFAFHN